MKIILIILISVEGKIDRDENVAANLENTTGKEIV